jgi:hypothetical protein
MGSRPGVCRCRRRCHQRSLCRGTRRWPRQPLIRSASESMDCSPRLPSGLCPTGLLAPRPCPPASQFPLGARPRYGLGSVVTSNPPHMPTLRLRAAAMARLRRNAEQSSLAIGTAMCAAYRGVSNRGTTPAGFFAKEKLRFRGTWPGFSCGWAVAPRFGIYRSRSSRPVGTRQRLNPVRPGHRTLRERRRD